MTHKLLQRSRFYCHLHAFGASLYISRTVYPPEAEQDGDDADDEAEVTLEKVEEEMAAMFDEEGQDDDEEENIMHLDDLADLTQVGCSEYNSSKVHVGHTHPSHNLNLAFYRI